MQGIINNVIYFIIRFLENFTNLKYDTKLINSFEIDDYEILTDSGYQEITHIHRTKPFTIYELVLENGLKLKCADNHIVFTDYHEVFVKDLKVGDEIQTVFGLSAVQKIVKTNQTICMYDTTVNSKDHRYFTNGILSHNTVISSIFLVWFLLFNFDKNVLLLGNTGATAKEIIEKVKSILENLPFFLKPGILKKDVLAMKFDNGCRIIGRTTTKTAAIGFTVHLLYCDEFAHIPPNILNSFWRSVYPTLSSSKISKVIITSTPNGMNLFYEIYNSAVLGQNSFKDIFVHWSRVPGRDDAWKQKEIANLGNNIESFNQEYECQFLSGSDMLFDGDAFKKLQQYKTKYVHKDLIDFDIADMDYSHLTFSENFDINDIKDESKFFVMSIDTSEGVFKDYSVINIFQIELMPQNLAAKQQNASTMLDFVRLKQVGVYHCNTIAPDNFTAFIYQLVVNVFLNENVLLVIEANSYGGEVIRYLYNLYGDDNEFDASSIVKYSHSVKSKRLDDGILITANNKTDLCKNLKNCVKSEKIILTDYNAVREYEAFAKDKKGNYKASSGNDDRVMTGVLVSSVFRTNAFSEMCEDYLDTLPDALLDEYEDILDAKKTKRENKRQNLDDYFDDFF